MRSLHFILLSLLLLMPFSANPETSGSLALKQKIILPNVSGRIDHMDFDSAGRRLFVAALGNNTL